MTTLILREGADRLHVELNRPDVRNAINDDMVDELHAVCTSLEREHRILILTGTSTPERGVFAAGADIRQLLERGRDEALAGINSGLFIRIARLPMPVIAAVDVFGNPETAIGILAAAGATWRLAELVGEPLAKEILFTGRRLDAEEALRCGLVASVHEPDQLAAAADTVADRIAGQDPLALRVSKRVLAAPRDAHPLVDELAQAILFESDAKTQLMTRFLNRSQETR